MQAGNYTKDPLESSKIVVVEEGTAGGLAEILPNAKLEVLPANEVACDIPTDGVQAFLIIGASDDIVSQ